MKKYLLILLGLLLTVAISCTREHLPFESGIKNGFRLKVSVEGQESILGTRASVAPEPGEETVQSLYLLFFEDQPAGAGRLINYYTVSGPFVMNQDINIDFTTGSGPGDILDNNTDYRVLAVANLEDELYFDGQVEDWLDALIGLRESVVTTQTMLRIKGIPGNTVEYERRPIPSDKLPMSTTFNKKGDQEQVDIVLTRAVVRFDVHNLKKQTYDLVSVSVWNAYGKTMVWKDAHMNYTELPYQRFYGVEAEETNVNGSDGYPLMSNIIGKLYSFENFVVSPDQRDKYTTCLIVGMGKRDGDGGRYGTVSYYRVNIAPDGSSQHIKRNNVYKLSINNILGDGAPDELQAYTQNDNKLDYNINSWNLDDNGMVLIDGVNTLVVPVKKIRLSPEGESREYSIFTSGPGTLVLSRVEMNHPGLSATLIGNRLIVTGTPMANGEAGRTGSIVLSIGSLDATIDILQSENDNLYLELSKSRTVTFPAYGFSGLPDGDIIVSSSGPWTAEIFNPNPVGANPGFSFNNNGVLKMTFDSEIDGLGANKDRFHIYTTGTNPDNNPRYSFVIVTLKANEEINRSLVLMQQPAGGIGIAPVQNTVKFDPAGSPATNNTFVVSPGLDFIGTALNAWQVEIEGIDANYFQITNLVCNTNPVDEQKFTVVSNGVNLTGNQLQARIKVSLVGGMGVAPVYIDIRQDKSEWNIVSTGLAPIAATGGNSIEIGINAPAGMHFTASLQPLSPNTLDNHWACFIDMANSDAKVSSMVNRDVSEKFKVYFPKLIWPNTGVAPEVVVQVTLLETNEVKTFIVRQNAVTQYGINIYNYGSEWGRLCTVTGQWNSSFNQYYVTYLSNKNFFGTSPSATITTSSDPYPTYAGAGTTASTTIPSNMRYVHFARPAYLPNTTVDEVIYQWTINGDGLLFVSNDASAYECTQAFGSLILGKLGLSGGYGNFTYNIWNKPENRIIKYLTQDAPWAVTAPSTHNWFTTNITTAGETSYMTTSSVEAIPHAVPVLQRAGGQTVLMIDPVRNVVVSGDAEIFQGIQFAANPATVQARFTANLLAYIVNATQYGSHFTDYFWDSPRYLEVAPQ